MNEAKMAELFGGSKRFAVLKLLFSQPKRGFTNQGLANASGNFPANTRKWLMRWTELGIVEKVTDGRNIIYHASGDPLFAGLTELMRQSDAVIDDIRQVLPDTVETAVIFGSTARGEDHAGSDIDVLILGTESLSSIAVNALLQKVGRRHGRIIHASVFSTDEFIQLYQSGDDFVVNLYDQKTLPLKGTLPHVR